ncbi:MAG: NifU family protein [Parcubacteria group bacterium]|nr:NifU family protein [Parcubacteria group bacterium]
MGRRSLKNTTENEIKKVLETEIKPLLAMHLGSLEYVGFKDGVVKIRFQGTCVGCPLSELTLKAGIEETLKSHVHGVERVEAVT